QKMMETFRDAFESLRDLRNNNEDESIEDEIHAAYQQVEEAISTLEHILSPSYGFRRANVS
ncbi:MAG: hypothetical protein VCE12_05040, partial [Candidatus Latescibacterota bacterium]